MILCILLGDISIYLTAVSPVFCIEKAAGGCLLLIVIRRPDII